MQISGVVILYHPHEEELIQNIHSYIGFVDCLIVFGNSNCNDDFIQRLKSISPKIIFIQNSKNEGIAKPLNKALTIADKSSWLLTMDQDSYFEPAQAAAFFKSFNELFLSSKEISVVCPNHSLNRKVEIPNKIHEEVIATITSGSIINTKICKQLNGFDEKLFIDYVDFEYCYRCVTAGYKVIKFSNIYMNHSIGVKTQAGYFSTFKKTHRSIHSPMRVYFMVRNFLYVSTKFKKVLPQEIGQRKSELIVSLKNNILFSGKFFEVIKAILKGYLHFRQKKFSS